MPVRADYPEPGEDSENDSAGARPRVGQDIVIPVKTHTWDEMEGAVWQSVRGTSEGAMGYALAVQDQIQTNVEERFRSQTQALQAGQKRGEEFGCTNQLRSLLGRTRYLWE